MFSGERTKFRILIFITVFIWLSAHACLYAITEETASLRDFLYGSTEQTEYDNFYSRVVEGLASPGYNKYAPWDEQTNGFGNFRRAFSNDLTRWGDIVSNFLTGDFETALDLIDSYGYPYDIVKFNDTDTERTYYMLRERLNYDYFDDNGFPENPEMHQVGSFDYGWGLYIYNPDSERPIIITTPHPKDDFITIPISAIAFQMWDARYLMIAGAGREARWTRVGAYTNAKSLSDPTREEDHVFNVFYKAACSEIRTLFGRREFSPQMHSFDHTHMGYASLQISAGNSAQNYPGLPIRDISGNYLDIVNASPYIVFPADAIGRHQEVTVTDYYSVHYRTHGMNYRHEDELIEISNNINLPGYSQNRQVVHTLRGWNRFDVFSPFFHIEMEELPSCYDQNMETYHWFYGYDAETETWDTENFFTNAITYYTPWVEHLAEVLPDMFELDDGIPPSSPDNLRVDAVSFNSVSLSWDRSFSYDFLTYQILFATEPITLDPPNYGTIERNRISTLAGQAFRSANVTTLQPGLNYHLRIRAKDYNDEYSDVSNEVIVATVPANVTSIGAYGRDSAVDVEWLVASQRNNQGFKVWRIDVEEEDIEEVGSFETDSLLVGVNADSLHYTFTDSSAVNGVLYEYMVSSVGFSEEEFLHRMEAPARAEPIYSLFFRNEQGTVTDSVEFGMNIFTSDGFSPKFDFHKRAEPDDETEEDFIYAAFYYPRYWMSPTIFLQRDINGYYNPNEEYKTWRMRIHSNITDEPINVSVSDNYADRFGEKLFLRCVETGQLLNIINEDVRLQFDDDGYVYYDLYWGNLLPEISIAGMENQFYQPDEEIRFEWDTEYRELAQTLDLFITNKKDTLSLAAGLNNQTLYYDWQVPDSLYLYDLALVVRANLNEEDYLDFHSPYKFGIVPASHSFNFASGWNLITNPFSDVIPEIDELFGEDAQVFTTHFGIPDSTIYFEFGKSYWVFTPEPVSFNLSGTVRKKKYSLELHQGWNLIPNYFMQDFAPCKLSVSRQTMIGYRTFNWKEAVREQLVEQKLFTHRDDVYTVADTVRIGESFWLFSKRDDLTLHFLPFNDNPATTAGTYRWKSNIRVRQADHIIDDIIIGAPYGYYAVKPPPRPGKKLYFYMNEYDPPYDKMHALFKEDLNIGDGRSRFWSFRIELESIIEQLYFSINPEELPESYRITLIIDEQIIILSEDEYAFHPPSTIINGIVQLSYSEPSSVEPKPERPVLYPNFPNPFMAAKRGERSGGTTISFYLHKESKVTIDIFNIKGQRVIRLLDDTLYPDTYNIPWNGFGSDGNPVSSGVYLYRLNVAGKTIANKKMLMLK